MPSIRMVVTDKNNKVADKTVTFTNAEWDLVEESLKGWTPTHIANPAFDAEQPVSDENPPTIPAPVRWNLIDQVEAAMDRGVRGVITRQEKSKANDAIETIAASARGNKQVNESGDEVPVRVDRGKVPA